MLIKIVNIVLGNLLKKDHENVFILKASKIFLNKRQKNYSCNLMQSKMTVRNNLLYHQITDIFNLSDLLQTSMAYTERCFLIVAETNSFLQLDFALVKEILQSSKLHITSELEVFYAINKWIRYKPEERINLAKDLLLTIRLPILSDPALKYIMKELFNVSKVDECKRIINGILFKNKNVLNSLPDKSFEVRYCDQDSFNFLFYERKGSIKQMNGKNFENVRSTISNILISKHECVDTGVFLKDDVYIFVSDFANNISKVKKENSKGWETVFFIFDRTYFCACVLIDKIYIMGGRDKNRNALDSCIQFDTKNNKIKEIANIKQPRSYAACTTYKGKIVVSGGDIGYDYDSTNTVEAYDHVANTWTYMPSMVERRLNHSLVAIKSKLFVVGSRSYEIYDEVTKVFTLINVPFYYTSCLLSVKAISIGNKIALLRRSQPRILFLDTGNDKWCEKKFDFLDPSFFTVFLKIPQM